MSKYHLFAFQEYYPAGGAFDYIDSFTSIIGAINYFSLDPTDTFGEKASYAHLCDERFHIVGKWNSKTKEWNLL